MASDQQIVGVYEIKIEQGPALRAFEDVKKRLDTTKASIRDLNKEQKANIATVTALEKATEAAGGATAEQAAALAKARAAQDATNKKLAESVAVERALSAQSRELVNDIAGLTDNNLRFRDKMAQATLEAIKQSGVIEQLGRREDELTKSLAKTNAQLDFNEQQMVQLNLAYSKGEKSAEDYRIEQDALNKEIEAGKAANTLLKTELEKVSATTSTLDQRIHELNVELNAGKINAEQYRQALSKIEDETRKAGAATSELTSRFDKFVGGQGAELKSTLTGIANNYIGIGAAVYGTQRLIGDAVNTIRNFQQQNANLASVLGTTRDKISDLTESAVRLGPALGRLPEEVTSLQTELAKLGFTMPQILAAQEGVILLANATGESLGKSAEVAASTLKGFGLEAQDTQRVVDVMAQSFNSTSLDLEKFSVAMATVAPAAKQANFSVEDTTALIGVLADRGLDASVAGTALRSIFIDLSKTGGTLDDALAQIDSSTNKTKTAFELFGERAAGAAVILAEARQETEGVTTALNNAGGAAKKMADEQLNTLDGELRRLSATYQGFVVSIDKGNGLISKSFIAVAGTITGILEGISRFNNADNTAQRVDGLADAIARIPPTAGGVGLVAAAFTKFREIFGLDLPNDAKKASDAIGYTGLSVDALRKRLEQLKGTQDSLNAQGLASTAKKYDREIAALESLIGSKEKLQAAQAKGLDLDVKEAASIKELKEQLQALKESRTSPGDNAKEIADIEARIKAIEGTGTASKNAAGSVADLTARIDKLQEQQAQSTDSAQFAAYQKQIDDLNTSIEKIRNTAASDTPLIDEVFGKNLDALPPTETASPGTPMIDEMNAEERLRINAELRAAELAGVRDHQAELADLELSFQEGQIESLDQYNARRAEIIMDQARSEIAVQAEVLSEVSQLFADAATGQLKDQQEFQKRFLLILIDAAEKQAQISIAKASAESLAQPDSVATLGASGFVRSALMAALIKGVFASLKGLVQGLATGGTVNPSGTVTSSWGHPVKRSNGDNVLVSTLGGPVTLRTGEKVLNDEQQRRAESLLGPGIWSAIGLPGHGAFGGKTMARHYLDMGYAEGGTIGVITPRPSTQTLVQSQMVAGLSDMLQRPIYTSIVEVNDVQNRVGMTETAREL